MNDDLQKTIEATHYLLKEIIPSFFPLLFAPMAVVIGIRIGSKMVTMLHASLSDEKAQNDWSDEKPKNDNFGYEDDKPKRLVLNEDGEIEGWE